MKIKRPTEVQAEINRLEDLGEFVQAGYLMAPGLKAHTGDSLEQMLDTCDMMDILAQFRPADFAERTKGIRQWINEQLVKGDDDGTDSEGGNQLN